MIAQVIPLLRLPRDIGVFDYILPEEMCPSPGCTVVIQFRRKNVIGIVDRLLTTSAISPKRLKPITRLISSEPVLTPTQRLVAHYVSDQGYASLATTLRGMLPSLTLKGTLDLPRLVSETDAQVELKKEPPRLLTYRYTTTKYTAMREAVSASIAAGKSVMIIEPTRDAVAALTQILPQAVILDRDLTDTLYRKAYLTIRSAVPILVIGTRSAIFAPVQKLGLIIIDDEDADEHVQSEPNPRYDVRAIALVLTRATGANLLLTSRLPTPASLLAGGQAQPLEPIALPVWRFTDLEEAHRGRDYAIIPEKNMNILKATVQQGKRVLVVHTRAASFGSFVCSDCGYVATCSTCTVPFHVDHAMLVCRHCATSAPIPLRCPTCASVKLRGRGKGIPHVVNEIFYATTVKASTDPHDALSPVVVSTPQDVRSMPDRSFDLIVLTRFDSLLAYPRYDNDERSRRLLYVLAALLRDAGTLVVQGSPLYERIVPATWDGSWRTKSAASAERFGYPPAWKLLQLRRRSNGRTDGPTAALVVHELKKLQSDLSISGPHITRARSRSNLGGEQLLLRYRTHLPTVVRDYLRTLDDGWTVTIDPRELT